MKTNDTHYNPDSKNGTGSQNLRAVLNECKMLCTTNPNQAIQKIETLLPRLHQLNDPSLLYRAFFVLSEASNYVGDYQRERESMYAASSLEDRIQEVSDKTIFFNRFSLFYTFPQNQNFAKALAYSNKAIASARQIDNDYMLSTTSIQKGVLLMAREEYDLAMDHLLDGLYHGLTQAKLWEKEHSPQLPLCHNSIGIANLNIGYVYAEIEELDKALTCFERSVGYHKKANDIQGIAAALNAIGTALVQLERYTEAVYVFDEARVLAEKMDAKGAIIQSHVESARCYIKMGELSLAAENVRQAIALSKHNKASMEYILALTGLGELQQQKGEVRNAIQTFLKVEELSLRINLNTVPGLIYNNLAELYAQIEDFESAFAYQTKYLAKEDPENKQRQDILRVEQKEAIQNAEKSYQSLQKEDQQLQQRMEELGRSIRETRLQLVRNQEFLRKLQAMVPSIAAELKGKAKTIAENILKEIERTQEHSKEHFYLSYEESDQDFTTKLRELSSALTKTELRICTLTRLGLSLKQIAELSYISMNTVKTHRRSIRRKLGLASQMNLTSFLLSL